MKELNSQTSKIRQSGDDRQWEVSTSAKAGGIETGSECPDYWAEFGMQQMLQLNL